MYSPSLLGAGTLAAQAVNEIAMDAALRRSTPAPVSTQAHYKGLMDAATKRAAAIAPDASPLLVQNFPIEDTSGLKLDELASHTKGIAPDGSEVSNIRINPNADASTYAHELGHGVSQKTKIGKFVNDTRHKIAKNPMLAKAITGSLAIGVPSVAAALQEGDDDLAGSIGLAAALASPTLIDEALASKNALAIMNDAGIRANLGQRGRLAGGYLTYLAPVLLAGAAGNIVGNMADDYTALYDL